jgi:hypothetical protein
VFLHIADDVHHRRQGAQEAEDAAGSARVSHVDIHTVFLGDFDIIFPHLGGARQNGGQHHIGIAQGFGPVERGRDGRRVLPFGDELGDSGPGEIEPFHVDVHQSDVGIAQERKSQDVAHQPGSEAEATRANESDFGHVHLLMKPDGVTK